MYVGTNAMYCVLYILQSRDQPEYRVSTFLTGIKRIGQIKFPKKLDPGPSLAQRIAERKEQANRPPISFEDIDFRELSRNFDSIDHLIEMHGHIIGMKLSPDHR